MIKRIYKWYIRLFTTISIKDAEDFGLVHVENVYGDNINALRCRSIWKDNNDKLWYVDQIKEK